MSNDTKNTASTANIAFANIKTLSALVQGDNDFAALQRNVKESRKLVDSVLREIKSIERKRKADFEQEQEAAFIQEQEQTFAPVAEAAPQAEAIIAEPAPAPVVAQEAPAPAPVVSVAEKKPEKKAEEAVEPAAKTAPPVEEKPKLPPKRMYDPNAAKPTGTVQTLPGATFRSRHFDDNTQGQRPPYQPRTNNAGGQGFAPRRDGAPGGFNRPAGGAPGARPFAPRTNSSARPSSLTPTIPISTLKTAKPFDPKKKETVKSDEKKTMNKRTLIRKGFLPDEMQEERMGTRKFKNKKQKEDQSFIAPKVEKAVINTETVTVKVLSERIGKTATEIIKQLMVLGIMTTINSVVDFATMELVANELGVQLELKLDKTKEEVLEEFHDIAEDDDTNLEKRPPIVTIMGHVDHGKTSLLDAIRKTNVASDEAGGITQHIGAYTITIRGEKITFIDTPGHEAFTEMRARGAKVTDIAILVVAADDGVMPQTIEAINHAKAANVPLIVAINKMDKPGTLADKIMQKLTEYDILSEEWGGTTIMVPISAKTGLNLDKLLNNILIQAEIMELRANPARKAKGSIIEARLDKGRGPVATIIVQNGTLHVGDMAVSGTTFGRIRAMLDDKGRSIKEAGPSMAVSVQGFNEVPNAGDSIMIVDDEKLAKQVADERTDKIKADNVESSGAVSLDDVMSRISEGNVKGLNIIVKADTQGSVEALKASLNKLSNEEVKVNTIHGGVGAINKSDIMLAEASNAIVIGFNVRADNETKTIAEKSKIEIRLYRIIYEALEDIEAAMKGMLEPKFREQVIGHAEVRDIFNITGIGVVAGLYVTSGKIQRGAKVRVIREGVVLYEGDITTLKRFKDDVKEVGTNYECGLQLAGFKTYQLLDQIEVFSLERILV